MREFINLTYFVYILIHRAFFIVPKEALILYRVEI